jgi:hypothetical protein
MYSPGMEDLLRKAIDATFNDLGARHFMVRTGKRADVPEGLGDRWANSWNQAELLQLAAMTQPVRQDSIATQVKAFLDDPVGTLERVNHAATQTVDADLQLQAQIAHGVGNLIRFNAEVLIRGQSPFTGKVKYSPITDIDVETTKAIIEVTTQADAAGKVRQLQVLLGVLANPQGKPVLHFMPRATAGAEAALHAQGSRGVYRDLPKLLAALNALP